MATTAVDVIQGRARFSVECADAVAWLDGLPADSIDLVFGSPPYMDARTYGINAMYTCQEWVDWMLKVTRAAVRVSKGLVLWVVSGVQRDKVYWPGCEGLAWEWWKQGNHLWRPCVWWKVDNDEGGSGIPGSGGKQWLRNDWEYVLAFKKEGWLPWADPLVMGHEPVIPHLGGEMSNRTADGRRINDRVGGREARQEVWGAEGTNRRANGKRKRVARDGDPWDKHGRGNNLGGRKKNGEKNRGTTADEPVMPPGPVHDAEGNIVRTEGRPFPKVANPGNVLPIVVKARVGGGHMGSPLCHESEAPFPEALAEFFALCFCPPGGIMGDCFSGSGTTLAVALQHGRRFAGCDIRQSQVDLSLKRAETVTPLALFAED